MIVKQTKIEAIGYQLNFIPIQPFTVFEGGCVEPHKVVGPDYQLSI